MSLRDNIFSDISSVFMRDDEFAEDHIYNGKLIRCMVDQDSNLKRKNNNVLDISWDTNRTELHLYIPDSQLDTRPEINTEVLLDGESWRILSCNVEMGMYIVTLTQYATRYF